MATDQQNCGWSTHPVTKTTKLDGSGIYMKRLTCLLSTYAQSLDQPQTSVTYSIVLPLSLPLLTYSMTFHFLIYDVNKGILTVNLHLQPILLIRSHVTQSFQTLFSAENQTNSYNKLDPHIRYKFT